MKLREYQVEWLGRILAAMGTHRRVLAVCPTAGGKTVVAAHLARHYLELGRRVLFVVHRREIVNQIKDTLRVCGIERVGLIQAGDLPDADALAQVASLDTLRARGGYPDADLVVVDEAHHAAAKKYQRLFAKYPEATFLGLTATPARLDGKPLREQFDVMVESAAAAELVKLGHLAAPRCYSWPAPDLEGVKRTGGDFSMPETAARYKGLIDRIIPRWEEHCRGLATVCFACTLTHAEQLAERFRLAGARVGVVVGTTDLAERQATLKGLESGTIDVVVNVGVLTEGWDAPKVDRIMLCRPTQSPMLHLQMLGRIMRPSPEGHTKEILDFAGNCQQHGLPDKEWNWSLEEALPKAAARGSRELRTKVCEGCQSDVAIARRTCPGCGHEFWAADGVPPEDVTQHLAEMTGPSLRERAVAMIRNGFQNGDIARSCALHITTVSELRRRLGIPSRKIQREKEIATLLPRALELLRTGSTVRHVAEQLGVSTPVIDRWRKQSAIPPTKPVRPRAKTIEQRIQYRRDVRERYREKHRDELSQKAKQDRMVRPWLERDRSARYRASHMEEVRKKNALYREINQEKCRERNRQYRARKKAQAAE